jgi:ubiquinone/menaquinone biosynthesis C-methylase UbiE
MDAYTTATMDWLNTRYRMTTPDGIYFAHQPIYGFDDLHCEPSVVERYIRTYRILEALASLQGQSLLDIGASEGYQASLERAVLGLDVTCTDLAAEACKRARAIYNLSASQSDARSLPFADGQFDLVTCSETLEHIEEYQLAVEEMLRVAQKAVIITVPHETAAHVQNSLITGELHAHVNAFTLNSFDYLKQRGIEIIATQHQSEYLYHPSQLIEHMRNRSLAARAFAGFLIQADSLIAKTHGNYGCMRFVVLKERAAYTARVVAPISIFRILNYQVPYQRLSTKNAVDS